MALAIVSLDTRVLPAAFALAPTIATTMETALMVLAVV